jgi:hypothetical protein
MRTKIMQLNVHFAWLKSEPKIMKVGFFLRNKSLRIQIFHHWSKQFDNIFDLKNMYQP